MDCREDRSEWVPGDNQHLSCISRKWIEERCNKLLEGTHVSRMVFELCMLVSGGSRNLCLLF